MPIPLIANHHCEKRVFQNSMKGAQTAGLPNEEGLSDNVDLATIALAIIIEVALTSQPMNQTEDFGEMRRMPVLKGGKSSLLMQGQTYNRKLGVECHGSKDPTTPKRKMSPLMTTDHVVHNGMTAETIPINSHQDLSGKSDNGGRELFHQRRNIPNKATSYFQRCETRNGTILRIALQAQSEKVELAKILSPREMGQCRIDTSAQRFGRCTSIREENSPYLVLQ